MRGVGAASASALLRPKVPRTVDGRGRRQAIEPRKIRLADHKWTERDNI